MEQFELYFRRADMDQDGRITGPEAVAFFQATNLPKQVLAQVLFAFRNFVKLRRAALSEVFIVL